MVECHRNFNKASEARIKKSHPAMNLYHDCTGYFEYSPGKFALFFKDNDDAKFYRLLRKQMVVDEVLEKEQMIHSRIQIGDVDQLGLGKRKKLNVPANVMRKPIYICCLPDTFYWSWSPISQRYDWDFWNTI